VTYGNDNREPLPGQAHGGINSLSLSPTSPVTALIGSRAIKPRISTKVGRSQWTEYCPSTHRENGTAAVVGNDERCGIGYD
jgi:hypothetical protein